MMKSIILLLVGLLTILVGVTLIRDSRYENDKFNNYMNKIKPNPNTNPGPTTGESPIGDWENAVAIHNDKVDSLSLYGGLSIAYGVIVAGLAAYSLINDKQDDNNMVVIGITSVGVIMVVLSIALKQISSPTSK